MFLQLPITLKAPPKHLTFELSQMKITNILENKICVTKYIALLRFISHGMKLAFPTEHEN
jgi:hypothetical protein